MRRPLWTVCLCLVAVIAVWLHLRSPSDRLAPDGIGLMLEEGETLTVTGRVYQIGTRESYGRERLLIYLDSISILRQNTSKQEVSSSLSYHLICEVEESNRPLIGSFLKTEGQFTYFSHASNPGEFNPAQYHKIINIAGTIKNARILWTGSQYSKLKEGLYRSREYFKNKLYQNLPEKEASVLCTMLLGDDTSLDRDIKELYKRNGIIHILSISGLHITIIGMGVYRMLRKSGCPVPIAAIAGSILLILYGVLTGMSVSAFRAIGMYLIRMFGECIGRTYDMLTALGILAVVMLIRQPEYLYHCGFLLSFGSVCGIGVFLPCLQDKTTESVNKRKRHFWSKKKQYLYKALSKIKQSFITGLTVTLFTLPIHLWFFYEIPLYSVLINLIILPFVGILMFTGIIVMLIPGMGFLGIIDHLVLSGYENLCLWCNRLPFHTWIAGKPAWWQVIIFYGILLVLMVFGTQWKKRWKIILLTVSVILIGLRFSHGLTVHFIDVGQGDCICIQTDGGETYLFDGGSSSKGGVGKYILIPYLKYYGIHHIDAVFVSHPDEDHCNGIMELLEIGADNGITVGRLILPAIEETRRNTDMNKIIESAVTSRQETPIPISYIAKGTDWKSGNTKFACLHPEKGSHLINSNSYSECFLIQNGGFSLMLTGDVEKEGEDALLQTLPVYMEKWNIQNVTVLKVAHHGSDTSTSLQLLELLQPQISVISCGANNIYGHPHTKVLERLSAIDSTVMQTPDTGAIRITVNDNYMKVGTY